MNGPPTEDLSVGVLFFQKVLYGGMQGGFHGIPPTFSSGCEKQYALCFKSYV
jgi:hypothetical protein